MYYTHSDKALNVDQKSPKNYDGRMHPYRVNAYVLTPVQLLFGMKLSQEDRCKPHTSFWFSSRNFFQGGNLLLCKFLLLFYCFRTKFQRGAKVFKGANCLREHPPAPLWEKASIAMETRLKWQQQ